MELLTPAEYALAEIGGWSAMAAIALANGDTAQARSLESQVSAGLQEFAFAIDQSPEDSTPTTVTN